MEVDLGFYGWIREANQRTEENELDLMAEAFGMETEEHFEGYYPMVAVTGYLGYELMVMEVFDGKGWM